MRPPVLITAFVLAAACARPVLYYPTPEPSPVQAGRAATADTAASAMAVGPTDADVEYVRGRQILMPVAGVLAGKLADSFDEARDGDRLHRAIDIMAPRGTPIVATDDGSVLRMATTPLGGVSMYTVDPEHRIVYYYAHMDRYHGSMSTGRALVRGDTIGFVGTTGNAPKDRPHLHFQIMRMAADGKYWSGAPINPYPLLGGMVPR